MSRDLQAARNDGVREFLAESRNETNDFDFGRSPRHSSLLRIFHEQFAYQKKIGMSDSYDIFVSYAREDKERVRPIVEQFENQGWRVFWDERIPGGELWPDTIAEALENARCMVVVWSRLSISREWVREEALRGKQKNILVPVRIDSVDPPFGFGLRQVTDLTGWNNDPSHPQFRVCLDAVSLKLRKTVTQPIASPHSGIGEIISLFQNPATIPEALDRASREIPFRGSDRTLFEMKRVKYAAGMTDYEKLNWIQEMIAFLSSYESGR
jgi:hypothetical protein